MHSRGMNKTVLVLNAGSSSVKFRFLRRFADHLCSIIKSLMFFASEELVRGLNPIP